MKLDFTCSLILILFFKEIFLNISYTVARVNFAFQIYLSPMIHRLN